MRFYKKIVIIITLFFAIVSGVFLLTGVGMPGLRILVGLIFLISFFNLSVYTPEFGQWAKRVIQAARGQLAAPWKTENMEPGQEGEPGEPDRAEPGQGDHNYSAEDEDDDQDDVFLSRD